MSSDIILFFNSLLNFILLTWLGRTSYKRWRLSTDDLTTSALVREDKKQSNKALRIYIHERIELTRKYEKKVLGNIPKDLAGTTNFTSVITREKAQASNNSFKQKMSDLKKDLNFRAQEIQRETERQKEEIYSVNVAHRRVYRFVHASTVALRFLLFILLIHLMYGALFP